MFILVVLVVLGSIFQGVALFKTGIGYEGGFGYWGPLGRDGVWHEALVRHIQNGLPLQNPGFSGEVLTNYHYYYNLLVAIVAELGIPSRFLIYLLFPVLFSVLLGVGTFLLAKRMFASRTVALLAVYLAYFGGSFGFVVEYLRRGSIWGGESTFWANQPVSANLNPPFAVSLIILIFIVMALDSYLRKPAKNIAIAIVVLSGVIIGFKAYAGILTLGGLLILALKRYFYDKKIDILLIFLASFFIALLVFIPQNGSSHSLIKFQPFWLVDTMIDAGDRVGVPRLTQMRLSFLAEKRWLHFGALEAIFIAIFFVGNLGTRIFAFAALGKELMRIKTIWFLLPLMGGAFVFPLVLVQEGNPWNVVQFFYYFIYFASLFTAFGLIRLIKVFPGRTSLGLVLLVLILTPISSLATFRGYLFPNPPARLSGLEIEALEFLARQEPGVVLKKPFDGNVRGGISEPFPLHAYADSVYVSAYSGKQVYVEDTEQQLILGVDFRERLEEAERFFMEADLDWSGDFLFEKIDYVYLPKFYLLPAAEAEYPMFEIFENDEVKIYKVNDNT